MNVKKLYISVTFFYFWPIIKAEPVIQLTLQEDLVESAIRLEKKIKTKGTIGKAGFNHFMNASPVSGFFATYAGMLALSDNTGTILFPRRHTQSTVYVAITQDIIPVMRMENTVHHWEFVRDKAVLFYKIEEQIDKETNGSVWHIQEVEIPSKHIIPAEAVVLFGDPTYFYFDIAVKYPAYVKPHIFLPPIIIKKGTNAIKSSLHLLSFRHFFGPLQSVIKHDTKAYQLMIQP